MKKSFLFISVICCFLICLAVSTSMLINVNFFRKHVVIYGNLEYVPPKQIDKLWDKAVDKWGDWQAAQHIAKKYDDDGYLRKNE